jgi:hypothetical protein
MCFDNVSIFLVTDEIGMKFHSSHVEWVLGWALGWALRRVEWRRRGQKVLTRSLDALDWTIRLVHEANLVALPLCRSSC